MTSNKNERTNRNVEFKVHDHSLMSGLNRFFGVIIIFFAIAIFVSGYDIIIPGLLLLISYMLFSICKLIDRLQDVEYELNRIRKKVNKKAKSSSK